jgi:CxxC motif-containing protein
MSKNLTCIECPKSCNLIVDIENCRVVKVSGNQCKVGESYATAEIENPMRIFTSTVLSDGLFLKMIPVRTDKPIPKAKIREAMAEIKKIRINKPVKVGDAIVSNFLGLGGNLTATRECL